MILSPHQNQHCLDIISNNKSKGMTILHNPVPGIFINGFGKLGTETVWNYALSVKEIMKICEFFSEILNIKPPNIKDIKLDGKLVINIVYVDGWKIESLNV